MKITTTNIPELYEKSNKGKIELADKVISGLAPLINKEYHEKLKKIKSLKILISEKKKKLNLEKNELEKIMKEYSSKKKIKVLLDRIMKLMGFGLLTGEFRNEISVILSSIETFSDEKLDYYLKETIKILNKSSK